MIFQDCLPDSQNAALQWCDPYAASIAFRLKCRACAVQSRRNDLTLIWFSIEVGSGGGN